MSDQEAENAVPKTGSDSSPSAPAQSSPTEGDAGDADESSSDPGLTSPDLPDPDATVPAKPKTSAHTRVRTTAPPVDPNAEGASDDPAVTHAALPDPDATMPTSPKPDSCFANTRPSAPPPDAGVGDSMSGPLTSPDMGDPDATMPGMSAPPEAKPDSQPALTKTLDEDPGPTVTPKEPKSSRVPMSSRDLPPPEKRSIQTVDLTTDKLLLPAPRVLVDGKATPALGGIPLLAKIGQGGMGAVYFGVHPRLRKEVAVKLLPFHLAEGDPAMIARFQREAQASAQVESPHLVRVLDVNEENDLNFIVMEYVRGTSAGKYVKQLQKEDVVGLPEAAALETCGAAAKGLAAAHQKGIVHRDVKPENVMIPYAHDASGEDEKKLDFPHSKLSDLGLARHSEMTQPITVTNATMGSPGFMAPEQIEDAHQAGPASDIFALGATLYCLLAGHAPFRGGTAMQIMQKTASQPHIPLESVRPDVTPDTLKLVNRCLNKKESERFLSAIELADAIFEARSVLPPSTDGPVRASSTYYTTKTATIQKTSQTGTGTSKSLLRILVALVCALALGGVLWYSVLRTPPAATTDSSADDWKMTLSRVKAAKTDLPKIEAAYAEFIQKHPLSDQAQEASKRRAELGKRIKDAREALLNNLTPAYAAREKGQWAEVIEFLEVPLREIGSQQHTNRERAEALLTEARAELKRRDEFAAKVREADDLLKLEAYEEALKNYRAAQTIWPDAGPGSAAAEGIKRAEKALRARQIRTHVATGRQAAEAGRWEEAKQAFEAALALDPKDLDARAAHDEAVFQLSMAEGQRLAGLQPNANWKAAAEQYAKALKIKPDDATAKAKNALAGAHALAIDAKASAAELNWRSVGEALQRMEKEFATVNDPALRSAVAAIQKDFDTKTAEIQQKEKDAQAAARMSQFDRAARLYGELKKLNPQDADAYDEAVVGLQASQSFQTALAKADKLRTGSEWEKARAAYNALLEENRQTSEASLLKSRLKEVEAGEYIQQAEGQLKGGELAQARAALSSAEKVLPTRAQDLVVRLQTAQEQLKTTLARVTELAAKAQVAKQAGNFTEARNLYTQLAGLDKSRRESCRQALEEIDVAEKVQQAKVDRRQKIETNLKEAEAALARGDAAAALKAARAVLVLDPTNEKAKDLEGQADFIKSFSQDTTGSFEKQRRHIGELLKKGRYTAAQEALLKCAEEQAQKRLVVQRNPKNYLPEEVAALESSASECKTMATAIAHFVALEPKVNAARGRLDTALNTLKPLPPGASGARTEVQQARGAIDRALVVAATEFANQQYFKIQGATATLGGKVDSIASKALTQAAALLDQAAQKDAGNAGAYKGAAAVLRQ